MTRKPIKWGRWVALAVLAGSAWYVFGLCTLHVVNGLTFPVVVSIDGSPHPIEPLGQVELKRVRAADREVVVQREDGTEIERVIAPLSAFGTNVFSVMGAAPVEVLTTWYHPDGQAGPEPSLATSCAEASFQNYHVDFEFQQPPSQISISSDTHSAVSRTALLVQSGGLAGCLTSPRIPPAKVAELALRASRASPRPEERSALLFIATDAYQRAGMIDRAVALVEPLIDDATAKLQDHRLIQNVLLAADRREELLERYRHRYEKDRTAENAYLLARLADSELALTLANEGLALKPDDEWLHRTRLWNLDLLEKHAEVVSETDWALQPSQDAQTRAWGRELRVRHLLSLHRGDEALDFLKSELQPQKEWALDDALLVEHTAVQANLKPWANPFLRLHRTEASTREEAMFRYFYDVSAGRRVSRPSEASLTAFLILEASQTNPEKALQQLASLPANQELYLTREHAWLLLAEAWRVGDDKAAQRLTAFAGGGAGESKLGLRFIHDGEDQVLRDLTPEVRFALLLARGRELDKQGDVAAAQDTFARLRRVDSLGGLAVAAIDGWKPKVEAAAPQPNAQGIIRAGALPPGLLKHK